MNATDQLKVNGVQYRLQHRKCGKPGCKCNDGPGHGPYWYSYDGNSAAKYVGAKLPEHVTARVALLKAHREKFKALRSKIARRRDEAYKAYRAAEQELQAIAALEAGEHADSRILQTLGLAQFNGHDARQGD